LVDPAMEREYNNRAKVPDFPAIAEALGRDAAAFRASHPDSELGVAYGTREREAMDIFWPSAGRDAPLAIFLHGGYWQSLDRAWFSHLAAGLTACGVGVAMPSYDLCPTVTLAQLVEQVREAAAFLYRRYGRPMTAFGHSAGGHLTAMLMATDWGARGLPAGMIAAGFSISGLFDLAPLITTTVNGALRLNADEARRLSPLLMPSPGLPLHALVGGAEGPEYERQSRSIAEAWCGTWELVPGANHFTVIAPLAYADSAMTLRLAAICGSLRRDKVDRDRSP
jgi:arylformamidase